VPVLAGVMLRVTDGRLHVSGFDYEVSSQVSVEVQADADGAALVTSPRSAVTATAVRHGIGMLDTLIQATTGTPWIPPPRDPHPAYVPA
jgi:hypothetical protein